MIEEGPKLYTHKPKKAQLKQFREQVQKGKDVSSPKPSQTTTTSSTTSSAAAKSYQMGPPPPPPPPSQPPKESFARRYKFLWPLLLTVNLVVGAYVFMRTTQKDKNPEDKDATSASSTPGTTPAAEIPLPVISKPVKPSEPIPENQQRELFKWILEEKRKIKPKDSEEKKRIDEEKAILKQLIRAKSIPTI